MKCAPSISSMIKQLGRLLEKTDFMDTDERIVFFKASPVRVSL